MPRFLAAALRQNRVFISDSRLISKAVAAAAQASRRTITAALVSLSAASATFAADIKPDAQATVFAAEPSAYAWTGLYLGGHMGHAWGNSNWTTSAPGAPGSIAAGSFNLSRGLDTFDEAGSFFGGLQIGYNHMLQNRVVLGAEADVTFPAFPYPITGLSIGGSSALSSRALGQETYRENVFASGTLRGRLGYAPGNWLYYATGGLAWTSDQFTLTQLSTGNAPSAFMARLGWAAGAGVEGPLIPHWTVRLEYLYTGYGNNSMNFASLGQRFNSDLSVQEVRAGLNYQFGAETALSEKDPAAKDAGNIAFHGQFTGTWQGYPAIRSPYQGPNSLRGGGEARETTDLTLYAGYRLWKGAELWVDPELDQGFGAGDTHGASGFPSGESYKLGQAEPYARVQRYFVRQTIDLAGETQKVEEDTNQFAGTTTADRLVLTVGKFAAVDIFDTNKYANNPKIDFLNWAAINAGTFDYAGDAWGYTYGAAAELYKGRWTLRAGIFDLSKTPAGGNSPLAYGSDPTFRQFQAIGEIEERHDLRGQPGKIKITGFLQDGIMGSFADANRLAAAARQPADINAVRTWHIRPGVSFNLEQQVTPDIGVFARAGWVDGRYEPWDFTDTDRTVQAGVSISGKEWGRPDDRVGIVGIFNGISSVHAQFFNLGGIGILVGDGQLPHAGWEKILGAYYSYALTSSTKLGADYQFIENPGFNADRGPANVFAGRVHWQF